MVGDFLAGGLFVLQPVQKVTAAIVLTQPLQSLPVDAEQLCQAAFLDRQRSAIAIFTGVLLYPYRRICSCVSPRRSKLSLC